MSRQKTMDKLSLLFLFLMLSSIQCNICPPSHAGNTQDIFGALNYTQQGVWYHLPCLEFRPDEIIDGILWHKVVRTPDRSKTTLISYFVGDVDSTSERYDFSSDFSLLIKGVEENDAGTYECEVAPRTTMDRRFGEITIQVIGTSFTFPTTTGDTSQVNLERGRINNILQCPCASQNKDKSVLYWSTAEGASTPADDILATRFADGTVLQVKYGADFGIDSNSALRINSLTRVQDGTTFGCHVFFSDGTLNNCYTEVKISDGPNADKPLKASETSFYLEEGRRQPLPCADWTSGEPACEIQWLQVQPSTGGRNLLIQYNVSTGDLISGDSSFDLADDFSLIIETVNIGNSGSYICTANNGVIHGEIQARVIGDQFPVDDVRATAGKPVYFALGRKYSLTCPAASNSTSTTPAKLFWSFGAPGEQNTTVIGSLERPLGKLIYSVTANDCFRISVEGSLTLTNCSQATDMRFWCNLFPDDGVILGSYVDVIIEKPAPSPSDDNTLIIIIICLLIAVAIIILILVLIKLRKRIPRHSSDDREQGRYKKVTQPVPVPALNVTMFSSKLKRLVMQNLGMIPIAPFATSSDLASMDDVYTQQEMFVSVDTGDGSVKYRIEASEILEDGIAELASSRVIIEGRSGSGKTSFLHKMAYDWSRGDEVRSLWPRDRLLFVLPFRILCDTRSVGEAVSQHMLKDDPSISPASIDAYCANPEKLVIFVDGCDNQNDVEHAMTILEKQDLGDCQIVVTTRHANLSGDLLKKYSFRHIIITGFTHDSAKSYIERVIKTYKKKKTETQSRRTNKSPAEETIPPEDNGIKAFQAYLDNGNLSPDVARLPAVLQALCQLSIWTQGRCFGDEMTMGELFMWFVRCMFDRTAGEGGIPREDDSTRETIPEGMLTESQLRTVVELGRMTLEKMPTSSLGGPVSFSDEDLPSESVSDQQLEDVNIGTKIGMLCREQEPRQQHTINDDELVLTTELDTSQDVPEVRVRSGLLISCCSLRPTNDQEMVPMKQGTDEGDSGEATPKRFRTKFVLEILQEFCAGMYLAQQSAKEVKKWLDTTAKDIKIPELVEKYSNVLAFASRNGMKARTVVDYFGRQFKILQEVYALQRMIELCLRLNFEGKCEESLHKNLSPICKEGKVRLVGISRHKMRLLSYFLQYAAPKDKRGLDVKSLKLFRVGKYDWSELQEYLHYFGMKGFEEQKHQPSSASTTQSSASGNKSSLTQARGAAVSSECQDVESSLSDSRAPQERREPESPSQIEMTEVPSLKTASHSENPTALSSSKSMQTEPVTKGQSTDVDMTSFENKYSKETMNQLRGRLESKEPDLPQFPEDQSVSSLVLTLKSINLHEIIESQAGECRSTKAARSSEADKLSPLVVCLPGLDKLESLVLIGSLLSSKDLCNFGRNLNQLPNLRTLDLRLNKHIDDMACVAITNSLHACKKLKDLKLSLYQVNSEGFDRIARKMVEYEGEGWLRLTTLYLLHGNPSNTLVNFLSGSLQYFHFVERFHISCLFPGDVSEGVQEEFEAKMSDEKIMPNLEEFNIGSMETLRERMSKLKLPKKKKGSILPSLPSLPSLPHFSRKPKDKVIDNGQSTEQTQTTAVDDGSPLADNSSNHDVIQNVETAEILGNMCAASGLNTGTPI